MRLTLPALYLSLLGAANAAMADPALAALRAGDMEKLTVLEEPIAAPDTGFEDLAGNAMTLSDLRGRVVVLNFWATWCAPCREEMPTLSALDSALGGEEFRVVTMATGRNDAEAMARFMAEVGADGLTQYRDPRQALARSMGVLGLPVTVILDREGREVARLMGDADWSSASAMAIMEALIAG